MQIKLIIKIHLTRQRSYCVWLSVNSVGRNKLFRWVRRTLLRLVVYRTLLYIYYRTDTPHLMPILVRNIGQRTYLINESAREIRVIICQSEKTDKAETLFVRSETKFLNVRSCRSEWMKLKAADDTNRPWSFFEDSCYYLLYFTQWTYIVDICWFNQWFNQLRWSIDSHLALKI